MPALATASARADDRRRFVRYALSPMYTPVTIRTLSIGECGDSSNLPMDGHAYDISESGLQFELDFPLPSQSEVAIQVQLPGYHPTETDTCRTILVFARVVWINDEEPGPVRMAAVFTRFAKAADRERLLRQVRTGRYRLAA